MEIYNITQICREAYTSTVKPPEFVVEPLTQQVIDWLVSVGGSATKVAIKSRFVIKTNTKLDQVLGNIPDSFRPWEDRTLCGIYLT